MKRRERVEETVSRYKIVEKRCDICWKEEKDWRIDYEGFTFKGYAFNDGMRTKVEATIDKSYHAGDVWGYSWYMDICPDCFVNKLIPFVESFGHTKIEVDEF